MHSIKLALVSALLVAGCAADDHLGVGAGAADPSLSAAAVAESGTATTRTAMAPDLAAERTASTSATAPDTAGETTAPTPTTTPADTTSETTTTTAPTPTTTPADTTSETTTTTAPTPTTTPADTTSETTTTTAPTPTTTPADTTSMIDEPGGDGFALFVDATCDVCHRAGGEGADLSASTLHIDAVIEVIRFGVTDTTMEGWDFEPKPPGLTRAEIEAVAAYVMSLRNG